MPHRKEMYEGNKNENFQSNDESSRLVEGGGEMSNFFIEDVMLLSHVHTVYTV